MALETKVVSVLACDGCGGTNIVPTGLSENEAANFLGWYVRLNEKGPLTFCYLGCVNDYIENHVGDLLVDDQTGDYIDPLL